MCAKKEAETVRISSGKKERRKRLYISTSSIHPNIRELGGDERDVKRQRFQPPATSTQVLVSRKKKGIRS